MKNLIYMRTISASDKLLYFPTASYKQVTAVPCILISDPRNAVNFYGMFTLMEIHMAQKHSNNTFSLPDC